MSRAKNNNPLIEVAQRVSSAAKAAGRNPSEVKIVAVSKTFPAEAVRFLHSFGQTLFAENYVQEAVEKKSQLADLNLDWHFIGALQTNKVKLLADQFSLIHSVDRLKLAEEISKRSANTQKILIEVNLVGESTKSGVSVPELPQLLQKTQALPNLQITGLMFMPPLNLTVDEQLQYFSLAKKTSEAMKKYISSPHHLTELSMGTSHDFESAVREGATLIRLGTVLFGERNYK